jgi:hypothetical protein
MLSSGFSQVFLIIFRVVSRKSGFFGSILFSLLRVL